MDVIRTMTMMTLLFTTPMVWARPTGTDDPSDPVVRIEPPRSYRNCNILLIPLRLPRAAVRGAMTTPNVLFKGIESRGKKKKKEPSPKDSR